MRDGPRSLSRATEAVATVEFALIASLLLTITGGLVDFGLAFRDTMQLAQAVSNGASYAFATQQAGTAPTQQGVQAAVHASTTLTNVAVPVAGPEAECTQTTGTSTSLVSGTYGQPCANGNPVGTYMVITAHYTYQPIMPFYSMLAESTVLSATATVRLY